MLFFPVFLSVLDEFKAFYTRLPQNYFLNVSAIQHLWSMDTMFQWRYEQLETSMRLLSRRAHRVIFKLFSLSKRCHRQPQVRLPTERWVRPPNKNNRPFSLPACIFFVCVCDKALMWFCKRWQRINLLYHSAVFRIILLLFIHHLLWSKSCGIFLSRAHTTNHCPQFSMHAIIQGRRWR